MLTKLQQYKTELLFLLIYLILMLVGFGLSQTLSEQKRILTIKINEYQDFKLRISEGKYISEFTGDQSILKISEFFNTQNFTYVNEGNSFEIINLDVVSMKAITDYLVALNVNVIDVEGSYNNSFFTLSFSVK
ncbi:MAG: hypothetical protein O3C54_03465 [Proteobacteria bacterium]|nr:hypothetical protein [Pseudomonadota bacterium]